MFDLWEDNIAILSPDGTIIHTNKSWKQFAQDNDLDPAECSEGTNYLKRCYDATGKNSDEASIAAEGIRDVISGKKQIFKLEYPCHSPDEKHWFLMKVTPFSEETPTNVLLQHIDITERKLAEKEIIKNEDELETIYKNAPIVMMLVDNKRKIKKINDYGAKFAGSSAQNLIDKRGGEALNCLHHFDDPNGCGYGPYCNDCTVRNTVLDTFETGNPHDMVEATLPFSVDGKEKELTFLVSTSILQMDEESRVLVSLLDITERKSTENELEESEAKFRKYVSNAPDGIFVADENGYYVDVNNAACKMTGYSKNELIGMNLLDLLPPDIHKYVINKFEDSKNKEKIDIEIPYLTKEGDKRWWRVTAASLSENRVIGFVKDITKQKNSESALSEALTHSQQREKEITELLNSTTAILEIDDFEVVARHIFDACARVIGAKAGYVALLSDTGEENELLFLEDGGMPCSVNPDLPMPVRGLRAEAYETGEVVYENDFMASEWVKYMPEGHMDLPNVLFSPLNIEGKTVGLLGFAYKDGDFTEHDAWLAKTFGEHAAIALKNSRNFELLEKSEQRYRSIFETAANLITSVDSNGIIVDCNSQIKSLLGYEKDEVIGQPMSKIIHPDYHDKAFDSLLEILVNGYSENKEYKMVKKSGELIDVLVNSSGINKQNGEYERTICIINDITQRNKNLQRINYLTDTLRCIRDVNQIIVKESNSYDLLEKICTSLTKYNNYTSAWIGILDENNKINMIAESGYSNKFEKFRQYIQKNNLPYCAQCALKASDYIIIKNPEKECNGCPLQNEYGNEDIFVSKIEYGNKIYGTIALTIPEGHLKDEEIIDLSREVVGDISFSLYNLELEALRQKAEESLLEGKIVAEEANRTKSEFLANMSHELRTPLNSILGFSQVLKKNNSNHLDGKEIRYVSNILNSGIHLLELINNILDISKVESGNMDYVPESVNIEEIVDDTIMLVSPMAKKKSIDLHVSFKHEYSDIQADRMKFKEIMYNLLSNAIKFTPEKGEVQVTTKTIDEKLQVFVSDTGIGIPERKFKGIFDPFKQVDSSANRKFGGTGLGLSLVKKYVEMHNGNIWVESEVGKGSTFTFTIPMKEYKDVA